MISINIFNEKIKDSITKSNTLDNIEAIILKYERRFKMLLRKRSWLLELSRKLCPTSKILFLKEDLYLYLLRNNLYRILNNSMKNTNIRKLVKKEILKAPKGTFSEFKRLYSEITNELKDQKQNDFILLNNNI